MHQMASPQNLERANKKLYSNFGMRLCLVLLLLTWDKFVVVSVNPETGEIRHSLCCDAGYSEGA